MSTSNALTEDSVDPNEARITDEALAQLRDRIGKPVERRQPHIEYINPDSIRHWAEGIGDTNPRYLNEEYARKTSEGVLTAPPTILYAMDRSMGFFGGLPGVHSMFGGSEFIWERPLRDGDHIRGAATLGEIVERRGRFAGRMLQQFYNFNFTDVSSGVSAAKLKTWVFRTERAQARERGKYSEVENAETRQWSPEAIRRIRSTYAREREFVQNVGVRTAADVEVGDDLVEIVRGPYTATMAIAFDLGWGGMYVKAHNSAWDLFDRHPGLAIPNEYGVPEPPERVHWDNDMAVRVGVPAAYDYGPERVSWMGTLVTNWMGQEGQLRRLKVEVRRHNLLGEAVWCRGRVSRISEAASVDGVLVHCDLEARTEAGELSAKGEADVVLPR